MGQVKTSRGDKDKGIKQTPLRDDKIKMKKPTAVGKTGATTNNHNALANSRCRSKLSIGSSQHTQNTIAQPITQKQKQTRESKKLMEKMIKDSSLKLQLDKSNKHIVTIAKRAAGGIGP